MKFKILAAIIFAASIPAFSQTSQYEFIRYQYFRPGVHFKTWKFSRTAGLERFTEMAFPMSYSIQLSRRLAFHAMVSPFMSSMNQPDGNRFEFSNVTDTYWQASYILLSNRALLTVGGVIPSGQTKLDDNELRMAGVASNRPLNNPVTHFGSGPNINIGLALAHHLGSWVFGTGIGYSRKGPYDAVIGGMDLRVDPGDEVNIVIGVDKSFSTSRGEVKFTTDLIYTNYSEDELAGLPFFEAGDKVLWSSRLLFPVAIFDPVILSSTIRLRMDNRSSNAALLDNGDETELRTTFFQQVGANFNLKYLVNAQIYSNTVAGAQGALILGGGIGFTYRLSKRLTLDPVVIFHQGHINTGPNEDIGITGIEISGGLSVRL